MALLLTEGFETYKDAAAVDLGAKKWTSGSSIEALFTSGAKTGANCARTPSLTKTVDVADEHATFIAGACYKAGYNVETTLISFNSDANATNHVNLRRNVGGTLSILRGTTVLATTTAVYITSDYHYFEMKATLHDTTGTIDVYVDSNPTPVLTFSGDTKNAGTKTVFDTFRILGGSFQMVDDIYLANGAGAAPFNTTIGEVRCYPLAPNGNGATQQGVGSDGNSVDNYLLVDEAAGSFNGADYTGMFTPGNIDLYTIGNLGITTGQIANVEVAGYVQKSDSGAKSARLKLRTAATNYDGSTDTLTTAVWTPIRDEWKINPNTGLAWTIAEVNAIEAGYEALA